MAETEPWWAANLPGGAAPAAKGTPAPAAPAAAGEDWWSSNIGAAAPAASAAPPAADGATRGSLFGPTFDRLSAAAARGATFGLSDVAGAAGTAAGAGLRQAEQSLGGRTAPETMGQAYQRSLDQSRGEAEQFATEHPYASAAATAVGSLAAAAPQLAGQAVAGAAVPAVAGAAVPTLGRQIATSAALGAGTGAAGGVAETQQPGGSWRDVPIGAGVGALAGAVLPPAAALLGRVAAPIARNLPDWLGGGRAVERQALQTIGRRMGYDVAAVPQTDLPAELAAGQAAGRPVTLADVGGANVQGLAGKVARAPGEGQQIATDFLNQRDAGAPGRLLDDVQTLMVPSGLPTGGADNMLAHLQQEQATEANRLYGIAGANAGGPQRLASSPELDALLQTPKVQEALRSVKAFPATANLADNDMQVLHEVYKNLGNRANQAIGDPSANLWGDLQNSFRTALTKANPDYGAAVSNFRDYAGRMDAIDAGRKVFGQSPDLITQTLQGMSPEEQRMFRLGAADTMAKQVLGTSSGGNEALKIVGNQLRQAQLRPLFENDAQFNDFIQRATSENQLFRTRQTVMGGSQTAGRLAEDAEGGGGGALRPLMVGGAAAAAGEPFAGATQLGLGLSRLARPAEINAPAVNAAIARRLYSADPAAQAGTLSQIMAMPGPVAPRLAVPIGGLAGQLAGPGAASALNWAGSAVPFLGPRRQ
jgi:hypothetical protein